MTPQQHIANASAHTRAALASLQTVLKRSDVQQIFYQTAQHIVVQWPQLEADIMLQGFRKTAEVLHLISTDLEIFACNCPMDLQPQTPLEGEGLFFPNDPPYRTGPYDGHH